MLVLREFLQKQIDNIDKIPDTARLMIITKQELVVVATLAKSDITSSLKSISDEYLNMGIERVSPNKSLNCAILTITNIPDDDKPMFV